MAIFRRDTSAGGPSSGAAGTAAAGLASGAGLGGEAGLAGGRRGAATVVAPGTKVKGELSGATEIQILGEVEGEVRVDALVVVGAGGVITGPVQAKVVRVVGQVIGNVTAADVVEVGPAGSLEGDIAAPRVVIAEGAFFRGNIDMKGDKNQEPRRAPKGGGESPKSAAAEAGSK
jgi:cytoskeletal protein CcmA (bactofilin family)